MGRIALFVIFVAGLSYLLAEWVAGRLLGIEVRPLVALFSSIIVAAVLWTALVWWAGERLERRNGPPDSEPPGESR